MEAICRAGCKLRGGRWAVGPEASCEGWGEVESCRLRGGEASCEGAAGGGELRGATAASCMAGRRANDGTSQGSTGGWITSGSVPNQPHRCSGAGCDEQ